MSSNEPVKNGCEVIYEHNCDDHSLSVLHCASSTAHNNTQQNIMAASLAGKLVREKNGRFERHGWEKEVEICGKEGKDS